MSLGRESCFDMGRLFLLQTGLLALLGGLTGLEGGNLLGDLGSLLVDLRKGTSHVEGLLGQVIDITVDDGGEGIEGLLEGAGASLHTGEDLGDLERLRQETLDLTCTLDGAH